MPAVSKKQQKFMAMVLANKRGKLKNPSKSIREASESMSEETAREFAKTKRTGLPEKKASLNARLWLLGFANELKRQ